MLALGWVSILLAILGFAFVIIIHELGHFLFAKWAGVKVLRFSVGFPPIVWAKRVGETEYTIGLLWLGGYVKMLGEADGEPSEDPRSYTRASAGWRAAILSGGVLFNLVSSWILLVALAWYGMPHVPPVVGEMELHVVAEDGSLRDSPAKRLGLRVGDEIRRLDGTRTYSWEDVIQISLGRDIERPLHVVVRRDGQDVELGDGGDVRSVAGDGGGQQIGIDVVRSRALASAGDAFGELTDRDAPPTRGWELTAIDGDPLDGLTGQQAQQRLMLRVGEPVALTFRSGERLERVRTRFAGAALPRDLALGVPVRITGPPLPDSPAATAGLRADDLVLGVDGTPVAGTAHLSSLVRRAAAAGRPAQLRLWREGAELTVEVRPEPSADGIPRIGILLGEALRIPLPELPAAIDGTASPLAAAGMQAGDLLLAVGPGERATRRLPVEWLRGGEDVRLDLDALDRKGLQAVGRLVGRRVERIADGRLTLAAPLDGGATTVRIADLPAGGAWSALAPGDWLLRTVRAADRHTALVVRRGAALHTADARAADAGIALGFKPMQRPYRLEEGWTEAFALASHTAWQMVATTLRIIPKFFQSNESGGIDATRTLAGPIGIFEMMRQSLKEWGFAAYLRLVAVIGLNLFLVNLLPIPIVDGGQLLILGIETVLRRPLPDRLKGVVMYIGLALVVSLMLFALSLDVLRKAGLLH